MQRVAEVEIVLLRQQTHRLAQDADTAEAGIKKSDRKFDLLQMGSLLPAFRRKIMRRGNICKATPAGAGIASVHGSALGFVILCDAEAQQLDGAGAVGLIEYIGNANFVMCLARRWV